MDHVLQVWLREQDFEYLMARFMNYSVIVTPKLRGIIFQLLFNQDFAASHENGP